MDDRSGLGKAAGKTPIQCIPKQNRRRQRLIKTLPKERDKAELHCMPVRWGQREKGETQGIREGRCIYNDRAREIQREKERKREKRIQGEREMEKE